MRNVRTKGNFLVQGGTKLLGNCPDTSPLQPIAPKQAGFSGSSMIVNSLSAPLIATDDLTAKAADFGRQLTAAGWPAAPGPISTSTTSSLTKIGRTSNSPRKLNGTNNLSSMITSPLMSRIPA